MGISTMEWFFDMVLFVRDNQMGQFGVGGIDLKPHDKRWHMLFIDLKRNPVSEMPTFIEKWQYDSDCFNPDLDRHIHELCEYGYLIKHGNTHEKYRIEDSVKEEWKKRYNTLSDPYRNVLSKVLERVEKRFADKYRGVY